MCREKSSDSGFTLIELTMVALILGIITAIGIPSFKSLYERSEVHQAASEFTGTMRYVQQRAVLERIPIRIVIDVDENRYWVPVEEETKRPHNRRRITRHRSSRRSNRSTKRVREQKEIQGRLPNGFIFEFVYKIAEDREIRRREGEIYFYPDGSADGAYITILRLADARENERRMFIKVMSATGAIKSMNGRTQEDGSAFYRGYYDDPSVL